MGSGPFLLWEGTARWMWADAGSRRFLDDIGELGFRAAAWWWESNPDPPLPDPLRQHVIFCTGCRRAWLDPPGDATCECAPVDEEWLVDPDPALIPVSAWTSRPAGGPGGSWSSLASL